MKPMPGDLMFVDSHPGMRVSIPVRRPTLDPYDHAGYLESDEFAIFIDYSEAGALLLTRLGLVLLYSTYLLSVAK